MTQSNELNETFRSEDSNEDNVDIVKDFLKVVGSLVELDSHREHVQKNNEHNENVKFLISCQFEHRQSTLQLQRHAPQNVQFTTIT